MYYMYLDTMQIPIPPETLTTTINNKNSTIDLLGKGEVNVLKTPGLTEISFKFLLPNSKYPFDQSMVFKGKKANYYIDKLEKLKTGGSTLGSYASAAGYGNVANMFDKRKFQFIVVRMKPNGEMLQMTNIKCTLEDYKIIEDANEGFDAYADVTLKQWRDYGTKKVQLKTDENGKVVAQSTGIRPTDGKVQSDTAKVSSRTTLQRIVKSELGNTNNLFRIAKLNKIAVPAGLAIGQVINMSKKGEL